MKVKIILIGLLLATQNLFAGDYILFDHDGDGTILRKAKSVDGSDIKGRPDVAQITRAQYNSLTQRNEFYIWDGSNIIEKSQAEKDAVIAAEQAAMEAERQERRDIVDTIADGTQISDFQLQRIDGAIDNISNLEDAKVFLKRLCRVIIKLHVGE